jgi:uncharacterized protein
MTLTTLLVPTFIQMLNALAAWLKKAQEQLPEAEVQSLLGARLAPDMFPLSTQVRFACTQAYEAVFRLQGEGFPENLDEIFADGRASIENPGTFADAQTRIDETIAMLQGLDRDAFDGDANRPVSHELPNGMVFDLTAEQHARDWILPQFYFHVTTAYSILRSEKVDLGKPDYVAHMFLYLRPGTMPEE